MLTQAIVIEIVSAAHKTWKEGRFDGFTCTCLSDAMGWQYGDEADFKDWLAVQQTAFIKARALNSGEYFRIMDTCGLNGCWIHKLCGVNSMKPASLVTNKEKGRIYVMRLDFWDYILERACAYTESA